MRLNSPVPELPEVESLARFLDRRLAGRQVVRCELASFAALKTTNPAVGDLIGRTVVACERRGKFLCLSGDGIWLVVHLARAGWVRWHDVLPAGRPRPGRSAIALRLGVAADGGEPCGFDLTEAGTEKRLSLWVVAQPDDIPSVRALGPDPLDSAFSPELLHVRLGATTATLKTALTAQSILAGVGNAYSDEALHAARLSPFKLARSLTPSESERLHRALVEVLTAAVARTAGRAALDLRSDKHRALRVHGRAGEACPVCRDTIREVAFATRSLQYCPSCQTGGHPLADRRLSRLLR